MALSLLIAADPPVPAAPLADGWRAAGLALAGHSECHLLVQQAVRLAPDVVVLVAPALGAAGLQALAQLAQGAPRPVLLLGAAALPADDQQLLLFHAWLPGAATPAQVADGARWALARFRQLQGLAAAAQGASTRLAERQWLDRAKAVLMRGAQLDEAAAHGLLRQAAMQAQRRLGEVSRELVDAAASADAINRAGQLRMLSQRLVKLLAFRASAGVPPRRAALAVQGWWQDSVQRCDAHLAALADTAGATAWQPLLQTTDQAWQALRMALGGWPGEPSAWPGLPAAAAQAGALAQADRLADALLAAADQLTLALQAASARPQLRLVNLSGRQRMLSQQLAKQVLLARLLPGADGQAQAAAAQHTLQTFEQALLALEQAPLKTAEIRATLAPARASWCRLRDGALAATPGPLPAALAWALVGDSETLLQRFDTLTTQFERNLQLLLA